MSQALTVAFADGEYPFRLKAKELRELERISDMGPLELYRGLLGGTWRTNHVTETIRLGLIGAGRMGEKATVRDEPVLVTPEIALRLVSEYVDTYNAPYIDPDGESEAQAGARLPWSYSSLLAARILEGVLMGSKDEPIGKKAPREEVAPPSPTADSDGARSMPASPTEG